MDRYYACLSALLLVFAVFQLFHCGGKHTASNSPHPTQYDEILARTNPDGQPPFDPATGDEETAVRRFIDFYKVYSPERIRSDVRNLYTEDAFFIDPFKSVSGIEQIESYFLKMAEPADSCTFQVHHWDGCGGEYYFRWTMILSLKRDPASKIQADGISHVRFTSEGKVIFQQDYWDSGRLFEKLPVLRSLIRYVKNRLEK